MHKYVQSRMNGLYDFDDDEERDYTRNQPDPISFCDMLASIVELMIKHRFKGNM